MGIITITRQYGSKGSEIGQRVSQALRYRLLDENFVSKLANSTGVSEATATAFDERGASPLAYIFQKYLCAPNTPYASVDMIDHIGWPAYNAFDHHPDTDFMDEALCAQHTQEIIFQEANLGDVVIVGRGAAKLLSNHPEALHIFVFASPSYRIRHVMMREGLSIGEASDKTKRIDQMRMRFSKRHFHAHIEDTSQYHLLINSGKTNIETAIETILEMAQNQKMYPYLPQAVGV